MQGRLSDELYGKIQAFPLFSWESEFSIAKRIGCKFIEWTVDYEGLYKNPLLINLGQKKINFLKNHYDLDVSSVTYDAFMQKPIWQFSGLERSILIKDFCAVCRACSKIKINTIVIPLVDNSSLRNLESELILIEEFNKLTSLLESLKLVVAFESDFPPNKLKSFLSNFPTTIFKINYDTGNSASLGYNPLTEFDCYGEHIINVHLKDRELSGKSVPLGQGVADFKLLFSLFNQQKYSNNFILQSSRRTHGTHEERILDDFNYISQIKIF